MVPSSHPSHNSADTIAGGTVDGIALLAIVAGYILFCVKGKPRKVNRRRQGTVELMGRRIYTSPKQGGLWELSEDWGRQPEGPQEMYQDNIVANADLPIAELGAEGR